jgi:hypothetical protein
VTERNVEEIQVCVDSKLCIHWMLGTIHIVNLDILQLGQQVKYMSGICRQIGYTHIFR